MKVWNYIELEQVAQDLQHFCGQHLQKVLLKGECLYLGFYMEGKLNWLLIYVGSPPFVVPLGEKLPPKFTSEKKPINLFLKAHLVGQRLSKIILPQKNERKLLFVFSPAKSILINLIPKAKNISVASDQKIVHLNKPVEFDPSIVSFLPKEVRAPEVLYLQSFKFLQLKNGDKVKTKANSGDKRDKQEKNQKIVAKLKSQLEMLQNEDWSGCLDWVKSQEVTDPTRKINVDPPEEWTAGINWDSSYLDVLEQVSKKAKKQKLQIEGLKIRIAELEEWSDKKETAIPSRTFKSSTPVKTRKRELSSGAIAYIGKSAKDNIQLLRQSKPWDLWLHARDYPSAHAFIHCNKKQTIPQVEIFEVARWMLSESAKIKDPSGVDCVITECRHVHPIKGDKLGRVSFKNERQFKIN